jgi:hypothetical protein
MYFRKNAAVAASLTRGLCNFLASLSDLLSCLPLITITAKHQGAHFNKPSKMTIVLGVSNYHAIPTRITNPPFHAKLNISQQQPEVK